jgi:hypothetical protein
MGLFRLKSMFCVARKHSLCALPDDPINFEGYPTRIRLPHGAGENVRVCVCLFAYIHTHEYSRRVQD